MPTIDEVKAKVQEFGVEETYMIRKEINSLPEILNDDESIKGITIGNVQINNGLVVLTNKRVLFVFKSLFLNLGSEQVDIPFEKINTVESSTGALMGDIRIWNGASEMTIRGIPKKMVKPFVDALNLELDLWRNRDKVAVSTPQPPVDIADQIKKLADLKEQGILTDEEFQQQKKKLLAA